MNRFKILVLSRNQHHHFAHLYNEPEFEVIESENWSAAEVERIMPDILLTPSCDWYESYECLMRAKELNIPSLYCPDGIIEWRHTWENPRYGAGNRVPYQQPVMADKISCMGLHSYLLLESFGNAGRCELTGSPRLNKLVNQYNNITAKPNEGIVLIATANTPGFTPEQIELVKNSLSDLKKYISQTPEIRPIWRVNDALKNELGLEDDFPELHSQPIDVSLKKCDAVITTQSTLILEAWLNKKPLATINYTNSPEYINPAWRICCEEQIDTVINELLNPAESKLHFQETQLLLNLYMADAEKNQIELIKKMINLRVEKGHTEYKQTLLPIDFITNVSEFNRQVLYPKHHVFKLSEKDIQQKLIFIEEENQTLKNKLKSKNLNYWFDKMFQHIYKKWN